MAIIGIGIDIVEIERIKKINKRKREKLACRILSKEEWIQYKKNNQPIRFLAKYFATKEAASKALGLGIKNGLFFSHFEIFHDKLGKPYIRMFAKAKELAENIGVNKVFVTISDERFYAVSIVILESK